MVHSNSSVFSIIISISSTVSVIALKLWLLRKPAINYYPRIRYSYKRETLIFKDFSSFNSIKNHLFCGCFLSIHYDLSIVPVAGTRGQHKQSRWRLWSQTAYMLVDWALHEVHIYQESFQRRFKEDSVKKTFFIEV